MQARAINQALGGPFVAPWEVGELDEATIEACIGLTVDLPKMRKDQAAVLKRFEDFRRQHPTYRK